MPRGGNGNGGNGGGGSTGGTIRGSNRDDFLFGSSADELIFGRRGDDTIDAGAGSDTVTGGSGADVFVVGPDTDRLVITDFEDGIDQIDVSAFGINPANPFGGQYVGYLADADGDTILQFFDTMSGDMLAEVVLEDFNYTQIDQSDYIF
ncbi:M10 family metallopeptidase C-terminal domain-containing protein [Thalassococcus lentus]|uniref:M10 family metallopeptidase C-terminal domain-containing protein n=1 Tax=Thalassococcus lentus TaxID=1210524 RepID=A0ABT4XXG8_9RHOB|nr:M10 family metallopeptidase C-terminal domain-containing protein [Thalassococcus lentus]MDA7426664.1 M10 family metallopeptidase C-terminal domain-containing protein [Thalassococcus lentus]